MLGLEFVTSTGRAFTSRAFHHPFKLLKDRQEKALDEREMCAACLIIQ
jgi:hypothetical protein